MPRRTWRTEIRLWNFATLDPSSREHAPTANSCKTEYCAMSLLIRGARVVRNQVRGAVVSAPPSWPLGKRWALKPKRRKKVPPGEAALVRGCELAAEAGSLFRFIG